jgi:RNA 2',3'-cyclic 3'-phosphodiesterase
MRAFIGIDFEREIKDEIYKLQQSLKAYTKKGRWKRTENFHVTLKFLDEINMVQKEQIDDIMRKICNGKSPFSLSLTGMGIFRGKDSIGVLWLGLGGETQCLQLLHRETDEALTPIGFIPEKRRFSPHITLGQDIVFDRSFIEVQDIIGEVQLGTTKVNNLYLFKSERIENKLTYTKVSEYGLS